MLEVREVRGVRGAWAPKRGARRRLLWVPLVLSALAACGRDQDPPIRLKGQWLVIENQSKIEWRDVSVVVNAYYKGIAPRVAAGGRLEAPLGGFVNGFGRRFDTTVEHVTSVAVRATDAAGRPVSLDWDDKTGPPLIEGEEK